MADINTSMLQIPGTSVGIIADQAAQSGILGQLSPEKPTLFGPVKGATFSNPPRAQIVGEGEAKGSSRFDITPWSAEPIKLHVAVRTTDEFIFADDDYRMGIMNDLLTPALGTAIGRGVDLIALHGINPASGTRSPKITKAVTDTTKTVQANGKPTSETIEAVGLVGGLANGVAFDGGYLFDMATELNPLTGVELNPGMGFGNTINGWRGLNAVKSTTVSGTPELATPSGIKAIVGDWSQVRWGFQRQMGVELLRYGNPDNLLDEDGHPRDLAGHNEVLLRAEAVLYVAIGNLDRFAVVKGAAAPQVRQ